MRLDKDKLQLEKLHASITEFNLYNEENLAAMNEQFRDFSTVLTALRKKHPNEFGNLYKHGLKEIRDYRKQVQTGSPETAQQDFIAYKEALVDAVDTTIQYIVDFF